MFNATGVRTKVVDLHPVLTEKWQREIVSRLKVLLAEGSALSRWLQSYHWNRTDVTGYVLNSTFEIQLNELALLADEAAKRIHQYGACALETIEIFIKAHMDEAPDTHLDARTMVAILLTHHTTIRGYLREELKMSGEKSDDTGGLELLTCLVQYTNIVWMLRMCLEMQPTATE